MPVKLHKTKTTRFFRVYLPANDKREKLTVDEAKEMIAEGIAKIYDSDDAAPKKPQRNILPDFDDEEEDEPKRGWNDDNDVNDNWLRHARGHGKI